MSCRYQLRRTMLNAGSAPAAELINLDKEIVKFGRNPEQVHVVLHSNLCPNMISREHAHIRQNRNADGSISYYLFDTSLNGTYVNDVRVNSQILLHPGDVVKFGHVNGAAMAPGQPAPQPYAEFAYTFEKVPRSTSSQVQTASISAQQVHAAAYDAAARRLAASPHAWSANPYAQLAAGPAAAAYLAATGFSHPYLGHIAPGLLTPPPSAAAAAAAASALSTSTTCVNQAPVVSAAAFPSGCGTYPGMSGNTPSASTTPHQQPAPFRPSSAVVAAAAAAEAAAWFNAAAVGQGAQTLPVYQHHQAVTPASPFALGGHLNATPVSSAPNAPDAAIAQHQQQQLLQHYQQQDLTYQHPAVIGSTFSNRKAAEMDALSSLTLLQKRHEQQQSQPLAYATPAFMQQQQHQVRSQQYSIPAQGGNMLSSDATISSQGAATRKAGIERASVDYMHVQSQTDVRPVHADQPQRQQADSQKPISSSPSDCEMLSPAPSNDREGGFSSTAASDRKANIGPVAVANVKSNAIHNMPVRESVLVEAQSVVRTFADTSACIATMTTTTARVKQSATTSPTSSTKEPNAVAEMVSVAQLAASTAKPGPGALGDLQKAECDSSVPSPPENPIRRKSTGISNASAAGNAGDDVQILDHQQSLNHDLLRLAADARSRCLSATGNTQEDVFDLECGGGVIRKNDARPEKSSSASSSSSSPSSDHVETTTKRVSDPSSAKPAVGSTKSPLASSGASTPVATPIPKQQEQQPTGGSGLARRKQRSNEVKRLFDDLQASYLFTQKQKKSRNQSSDSRSSSDIEETEKNEKKKSKQSSSANSGTSTSSSQSPSRRTSSHSEEESDRKRKRKLRAPVSKQVNSTSSSSVSASSVADSSDEKDSDDEEVPVPKLRQRSQNRGRTRNTTGDSTRASNRGGKRGRRRVSSDERVKKEPRSSGSGRGRGKSRGRPPGRRSEPIGSLSSESGLDETKRRRTEEISMKRARGRSSASGRGRGGGKRGRPSSAITAVPLRPEDAWKYHDPTQTCAAAHNCVKPDGDSVDWVECDDCERWFHVSCVGCVYEEVKDEDTSFHCGCAD